MKYNMGDSIKFTLDGKVVLANDDETIWIWKIWQRFLNWKGFYFMYALASSDPSYVYTYVMKTMGTIHAR